MCSAVTFRPSGTLSGRWSLSRETCRRDCIEWAIKCKLSRRKISVYQVRGAPYGWQRRSILLSYRHAQEVEHRRQCVLYELIRALLAAALVALLPGWFWTRVLIPSSSSSSSTSSSDLYERLTYSLALSMALVPAIALIPTRLFGMGVSLSVTVVCVGVVFFSGLGVSLLVGSAKEGTEEPLGSPPHMLGMLTLGLLAAAFGLGLGVVAGVVPGVPGEILVALLVLLGGISHLLVPGRSMPQASERSAEPWGSTVAPAVRYAALSAVLVLAL